MRPFVVTDVDDRSRQQVVREPGNKGRPSPALFWNLLSYQSNVALLDIFTVRDGEVDVYVTSEHPELHPDGKPCLATDHSLFVFPIDRSKGHPDRSRLLDIDFDDAFLDECWRERRTSRNGRKDREAGQVSWIWSYGRLSLQTAGSPRSPVLIRAAWSSMDT